MEIKCFKKWWFEVWWTSQYREGQREKQTERKRGRQRETERERDRELVRERERETKREREREWARDQERERGRERKDRKRDKVKKRRVNLVPIRNLLHSLVWQAWGLGTDWRILLFISRHTKKGRVVCHTLRTVWASIHPSVCPSVSASFPCSNFSIFWPIFFKLFIGIDIGEERYGIANRLILFRNNRVMALDLCKKCVFPQYIQNKWMNFDKILHMHWYI